MLTDYHSYSTFSHDGYNTIDEMCMAAIGMGVKQIAFTEHYDPNSSLYKNSAYNYDKYYKAIYAAKEKYVGELAVKSAIEVGDGFMHACVLQDFMKSVQFDFVLSSVHSIAYTGLSSVDYEEIEIKRAIVQYFYNIKHNLSSFDDFDCISHIDLPKRYLKRVGIEVNMSDYNEYISEIFKILVQKGKGIEVNSSSLRVGLNETLPSLDALKIYKNLGGEIITTGSDAHNTNDVGAGIEACLKILKEAGFKYFSTYSNRQCEFHKIK